jgi:hypothetical protein
MLQSKLPPLILRTRFKVEDQSKMARVLAFLLLSTPSLAWMARQKMISPRSSLSLQRHSQPFSGLAATAGVHLEAASSTEEEPAYNPVTFKLGDENLGAKETEVLQALTAVIDPVRRVETGSILAGVCVLRECALVVSTSLVCSYLLRTTGGSVLTVIRHFRTSAATL